MQLIYESKDITNEIEIKKAIFVDNAGGRFDSIEIECNDPNGLWKEWKPEEGDCIELKDKGLSSGKMYVDVVNFSKKGIILKALPLLECKEKHTKSWEEVTFIEIANEISQRYNLTLKTYDIDNQFYSRITQINESDIKFLNDRCILEGYSLKIVDDELVIFNDVNLNKEDLFVIKEEDIIGDYTFNSKRSTLASVSIKSGDIQYINKAKDKGEQLEIKNIYVGSIREAIRYTKNIYYNETKFDKTLVFEKEHNNNLAAGSIINIQGLGLCDGIYSAHQVVFKFIQNRDLLRLRKVG